MRCSLQYDSFDFTRTMQIERKGTTRVQTPPRTMHYFTVLNCDTILKSDCSLKPSALQCGLLANHS